MRKILITNDDGIFSEGLVRLVKAAQRFGKVWVVAPDSERSALSHSVSFRHSFDAWKVDFPVEDVQAFACSGTPADCVRIGVLNIVPGKPDTVFSGINHGYNLASDIQYSATAGAAFEAAFQKIHTIAFSEDASDIHEVTDSCLDDIITQLIDIPPGANRIWNVNFPGCPLSEYKGILRDRKVSAEVFYLDRYTETRVSDNRTTYMVEGLRRWEASEGTDLRAILDNCVSIGTAANIS